MTTIDRGKPLPGEPTGRPAKYPWRELEVGDSFFVEGETVRGKAYAAGMQHAFRQRKEGKPYRISGRKEANGVRIWRVE